MHEDEASGGHPGETVNPLEGGEEGAEGLPPLGSPKSKKHKKKHKQKKVPKVKKRSPNLVEGSEIGWFSIHRNYYEEDEAPDFKSLMQDLEDSVAEILQCVSLLCFKTVLHRFLWHFAAFLQSSGALPGLDFVGCCCLSLF